MAMLYKTSSKKALDFKYFPAPYLAVIWRNWYKTDPELIAKILEADVEDIRAAAELLGLDRKGEFDPRWTKRGYLTTIRNNWHLLEFDQIMTLIGMTEEQFELTLKEDDFLWEKMGCLKPKVERPKYRPLTDEERTSAAEIAEYLKNFDCKETQASFSFLDEFYADPENEGKDLIITKTDENIRYVYSYFALYGDPLLDPEIDPYPEGLLKKYAECGINGVWLQGVLYQLVPYPFDPELSKNWEKRIASLNTLIARAKKYGIGVYLYFNEPRFQHAEFFEKHPELFGYDDRGHMGLCTSLPEVQEYLQNAMERLFTEAPDLAGFFTITMSENQTNCFSRVREDTTCPRCSKRTAAVVVPEVSNLLTKGARRAKPDVKSICWTWAWKNEWSVEAVKNLTEGQIVMSNSEDAIPTFIGGVKGAVADYSMSIPGPGDKAKAIWSAAKEKGMEVAAKVQFSNSWEHSAAPYIPVYDLVGEHLNNLKEQGVKHLQLSWTLGGYPSPNLKMADDFFKTEGPGSVYKFIEGIYGEQLAPIVDRAQKLMCNAFRQFPFNIVVIYNAPNNYGPSALFYPEPTGYDATMVGFPYDDVDRWRHIYPVDVFKEQFKRLSEGWKRGLDVLEATESDSEQYNELLSMSRVAYCHFASAYNHVRFVTTRDELAKNPDSGELLKEIKSVIENERELTLMLMKECAADSRIGFEASNHYYYTLQELKEKLLNLRYCEKYYGIN